jgi:hypothetical protein
MDGEIEGDASGLTTSRMSGRTASVQIVERVSGRRIWTVEQKLVILGEAFFAGLVCGADGRAARDQYRTALHKAKGSTPLSLQVYAAPRTMPSQFIFPQDS